MITSPLAILFLLPLLASFFLQAKKCNDEKTWFRFAAGASTAKRSAGQPLAIPMLYCPATRKWRNWQTRQP
jgi:hypothetical protein